MLKQNLRAYVPTHPLRNLSIATDTSVTEIPKNKSPINISSETFSVLKTRATYQTNVASYLSLCSGAIWAITRMSSDEFTPEVEADLATLTVSLAIATRDNGILQASHEANLRLLERDSYLKPVSLPEDIKRQCRRSSLVSESIFGPEAQQLVNTSVNSLRNIMLESQRGRGRAARGRSTRSTPYQTQQRPGRIEAQSTSLPRGRGGRAQNRRGRGRGRGATATVTSATAPKPS